jgi:uncharacterized membrane protein YccF (DUF307 family)
MVPIWAQAGAAARELARGVSRSSSSLALTIIGIPFAWAHLKLAGLAPWPIGKVIVPIEQAQFGFPPRR